LCENKKKKKKKRALQILKSDNHKLKAGLDRS